MEVFYGYYMLVAYFLCIYNIFYSKKVHENKKQIYAAATKVLCLYLQVLPLLAIISLHSFSHSFSYYFANNGPILMCFFHLEGK